MTKLYSVAATAAIVFSSSEAFMQTSSNVHNRLSSPLLKMSTESVNYVVTGNNIEMTPSLNEYVNKKLDKVVGKLSASGAVQECDVHLSVNKNPKVSEGE